MAAVVTKVAARLGRADMMTKNHEKDRVWGPSVAHSEMCRSREHESLPCRCPKRLYCEGCDAQHAAKQKCPRTVLDQIAEAVEFSNKGLDRWSALVRGLNYIQVSTGRSRDEDTWIVWYEDASVDPEVFAGQGAEEAARARFEDAKQHWTCILFREVARG